VVKVAEKAEGAKVAKGLKRPKGEKSLIPPSRRDDVRSLLATDCRNTLPASWLDTRSTLFQRNLPLTFCIIYICIIIPLPTQLWHTQVQFLPGLLSP